MKKFIAWSVNPARSFFLIILATFWGYKLEIHKIYKAKHFGKNEREALKAGILCLPDCDLRKFLLFIARITEPPPATFSIKTFQLKEPNQHVVMTHEIMGDKPTFERVAALSLLGKNTFEILHNLNNYLLIEDIQEKHIARFLAQFWQVERKKGWTINDRAVFKSVLLSEPHLCESFKELIEYPLSDKPRAELFPRYDIPISEQQIKTIYTQTMTNRLIQESIRSKDPGTLKESELSGRVVGLQAKQRDEIMSATTEDASENQRGNLLEG